MDFQRLLLLCVSLYQPMDLQGCNVAGKVKVIQHISFSGKFQSEGGGDQQGFITVFLYNNIPCSDFSTSKQFGKTWAHLIHFAAQRRLGQSEVTN